MGGVAEKAAEEGKEEEGELSICATVHTRMIGE